MANSVRVKNSAMKRNGRGSSLIEVASIAWLVPVIALLCLNIGFLSFGAWATDEEAREAARAAALAGSGGVQTLNGKGANASTFNTTTAYNAAYGVLTAYTNKSAFFTAPTVGIADFNMNPLYNASNNVIGMDLSPVNSQNQQYAKPDFVKVNVTLTGTLPCPFIFYNGNFTSKVTFASAYAYPLTNTNYADQTTSTSANQDPNVPQK